MDSAGDAVLELEVHLGDSIFSEDTGVRDITCFMLALFLNVRVVNLRMAADSTMLRMVNLLIALSFGVHLEQLEQRIGLTWPRPFLLRPL